jgi:D-alanine-D-alanine ligase-like ATP-grasp enzyme
MILTENGPIILEINTLPGLTKASFIPQQLLAIKTDLKTFFTSQISLK